ncbi:MAG: hypothetical protein IJ304_00360 [Clostridia bacterium]|nr:hypothetical protein [Clostridia bacterium]
MKRLVSLFVVAIMLISNINQIIYAQEDNIISIHKNYIVELVNDTIEIKTADVCIETLKLENSILLMATDELSQDREEIIVNAAKIIIQNEGSYGSVNKNDNNHGMSIGKFQWNSYWGRALPLLQTIVKANPENAEEILGAELYDEIANNSADYWNHKNRTATDDEAERISELLATEEGKAAQDALIAVDAASYVDAGIKLGIVSGPALVYYADLRNQWGNTSNTMATNAKDSVGSYEAITLYDLHQAALDYSGLYKTRRNRTYDFALSLGWSESLDAKVSINSYEDDSNWCFDVLVENYDEEATVYAVIYDGDGKMLASTLEELKEDDVTLLSEEDAKPLTLPKFENASYVKILVWDNGLKPVLSERIDIK